MNTHPLAGIYAAAVTPLKADTSPDLEGVPVLLDFLAKRGCHGALLMGTTGEGPSFSPPERQQIWQAAVEVRQLHPEFRLFAGTGTPSLQETIDLNKVAFDLGFDTVVTLPPYYFRKAGDEGLYTWFSQVIRSSVPDGRFLLAYDFPSISGVEMEIDLMKRLRDSFPAHFGGLKDSTGSLEHAVQLSAKLQDRLVLVGNDKLLSATLAQGASGCITALANLISPDLRAVWDAFQRGDSDEAAQARIDAARVVMDNYQPFASSVKGLLAEMYGLKRWPVKPPLQEIALDKLKQAQAALQTIPVP